MATSIPVALRINDRGVPTVSSGPRQDRWPPVTRDQSLTVRDLRPGPDGDQDGTLDSAVPAFYQEVPRGAGLRDWFGAAGRNHGWGAAFDTGMDGPVVLTGRGSKTIARLPRAARPGS